MVAFGPCFDLATLVGATGFVAIFVAEMDLNPGEKIFETVQPLRHRCAYPLLKPDTAFDMVASHMNLHGIPRF
ncbi:hypothetical protein D9M68_941040 [compost metagenome]